MAYNHWKSLISLRVTYIGHTKLNHITRDDVKLQPPGLVVRLKWSKTHQAPGVPNLIPIPSVPGHSTDLLAAFNHMLHVIPTRSLAEPLLSLPSRHPVASRYLQRALRCISPSRRPVASRYFQRALRCIPTSGRPVASGYLQSALRCIPPALGYPVHAYLLHSMWRDNYGPRGHSFPRCETPQLMAEQCLLELCSRP